VSVDIICDLESDPATASEISNEIIGIEEDFERFARMTIDDGEFDQFACSDEEKVCKFVQYVAGTRVDNQDSIVNWCLPRSMQHICYFVSFAAAPAGGRKGKLTKYG